MVIIDEESRKVRSYRKVLENNSGNGGGGRRCYAVKVCIEKNPASHNGKQDSCVVVKPSSCLPSSLVQLSPSSSTPPSPPPPITPSSLLPPLRNPHHRHPVRICCACQPVGGNNVKKKKSRSKCRNRTVEKDCQTMGACSRNDRDTQCGLILPPPPRCTTTQDNECQTAHKELKHCGHEALFPNCEKCTTHCQTELERSCCVEGIAHDRNTCTKTCCNKHHNNNTNCEKRDVASSCCKQQQCEIMNDNGRNNKVLDNSNCQHSHHPHEKCCNRHAGAAACKQKHEFPFAGRTPSGNLKVCPKMISYENKEFGILVANPSSMRTAVRRVTSCEMIVEEREGSCAARSPRAPPSPALCLPKRFQYGSSGCSSQKDSSCKTACSFLPSPHLQNANECGVSHHQHYHHHRHRSHHHCKKHDYSNRDNLEIVQNPFSKGRDELVESECTSEPGQASTSHNKAGYADGWNYVNPQYQQEKHFGHHHHDQQDHHRSCKGEKMAEDATRVPKNVGKNLNGYRRDAEACKIEHGNASRICSREEDHHNHICNSGGRHKLELEQEDKLEARNHAERCAPYTPAFPQEKVRHQKRHHDQYRCCPPPPPMPVHKHQDCHHHQHHHTSTHTTPENNKDDDGDGGENPVIQCLANHAKELRQHATHSKVLQEYAKALDPELVGRLHYVVKGAVEPNAKVKVGNCLFPVQSVVLEIHKRQPAEDAHSQREASEHADVKLPSFNSLPITNHDDDDGGGGGGSKATTRRNDMESYAAVDLQFYGAPYNLIEDNNGEEGQNAADQEPLAAFSRLPPGFYSKKGSTTNHKLNSQEETPISPIYFKEGPSYADSETHPNNKSKANRQSYENLPPGYDENAGTTTAAENRAEIPDSDYLESKYLVPFSKRETILNIIEPNSSYQPPTHRKNSKELLKDEEKVDAEDDVLPNLDVIHGQVLVFGGINPLVPCTGENSGKDVYMYTKDTNQWTHVGVLPHPRTHFGLARVENNVYIIGGTDPELKDHNGRNLAVHTNLKLNLRSGKWDLVAGLEKGRSHCGCVAIGKHIFVIGGNIESRATSTCLVFNTESQSWSRIASLDSTRANMGIALCGKGILVAGGTSKDARKPVIDTVVYYEPSHDRWTAWQNLPSPRAFCTLAVTSDSQIYLIAGAGIRDKAKRKNSSMSDILTLHQESGNWMEAGMLQNSRHGHASTVLEDDSILVIAGISSHATGPINSVEIWSPSSFSDNSSMAQSFQRNLSGMCALTL